MFDFRRLTAALAVLCLLFVSAGCRKQASATNPTQPASPYVRLATYNAVLAEANLAAAKAVRNASQYQMIPAETVREIFAWQARVAKSSRALAVALSDAEVDLKSAQITAIVLDLTAPPVFDRWLTGLDSPQQQLVVSSLKALAATVTLMVREFGTREAAGAAMAPRHPARANLDAWLNSRDVQRELGQRSTGGELITLGRLWQRAHGYPVGGAL